MKIKNIYTVIAYRFGDIKSHSYLVGVFAKKAKAIEVADLETESRGAKYSCHVNEVEMDHYYESVFNDPKTIYKTKSI